MTTQPQVRFFLGANSPQGFYSLYDQLIDPAQARGIYILKGGPGCGKSSLMRRVARKVEEAGFQVEYISCSGDPDSLDAVHFPELKIAVADGTAPHVLEPKYPGVVESYLNLGECYDKEGLGDVRQEIMACMGGYKGCYSRAYRCLGAAAEISGDLQELVATPALEAKMAKRAKGIISRELKKGGGGAGGVYQRFLSGITCQGQVCFYDTAELLCKRTYELADSYGLAHLLLTPIAAAAAGAGYQVIACPSPMAPDRLEHVLVPELSLAFLSSSPGLPYPRRPYRRIRLGAMVDRELARRTKPRIKFSKKVSAALLEEAVESLAQAKAMHDDLEALYNPHVDFPRVYAVADRLAEEILKTA